MKAKLSKALMALLCAVTLLVGAVPFSAFTVSAEMGCDFPWTKEQTLLEKIIQRDGLLDGIWFPWFNGGEAGHNLTGNDVMAKYYGSNWARVELDRLGADQIYQQIYNLKAMGYNMMAWGGSIYGEGVQYDEYGDVVGIKEDYLANARRLLDMCREIGMPVMWNVYFHCSSAPNYYGMEAWNITCRMLGDRKVADHYAEKFVKPLCEMLKDYTDVVALVSIADEPENEINDVEIGTHFGGDRAMYGVNRDDMIYFMKQINDTVRKVLPKMPRTVASNNMNKTTYRGFQLDLMGHNRYDNNANIDKVESFYTDADVILTEYNIGGDAAFSDDTFTERLITFRKRFMEQGYKGGFQWCWMHQGTKKTAYYLLNSSDNTDFRETVTDLRHYIDDYRAEYRGEKIKFDVPVMYANDGTGLVEWIPSRNATQLTIQRSDDGGKTWTDLITDANPADYLVNGKGEYKDKSSKPADGFCYRVTMSDGNRSATSEPNQPAGFEKKFKKPYKAPSYHAGSDVEKTTLTKLQNEADPSKLVSFAVPTNRPIETGDNLIKNGSFEKKEGQWTGGNFLKYAQVVSDSTAPEGNKSLLFNSAGKDPGFCTFTVTGLEPYERDEKGNIVYEEKDDGTKVPVMATYTFSAWIKGDYLSKNNVGDASIGVIDPDTGKFMVYYEYYRGSARTSREDEQIYPTAWDGEWHLRSVQFTTDKTSATIALYGKNSKMWVDGMALYESANGTKYTGSNLESYLRYSYDVPHDTCDSSNSLLKNVRFEDSSSTFWQSGDGWRNGFLKIVDQKKEYGKSLKYTPSDAVGNYYIKWVDIKPNTEYIFSGSMKILKNGRGHLALVEDSYREPYFNYFIEMGTDFYGDDWFNFSIRFNSSGFNSVGIGICDLGGEALIDNLRLFKVSDGKDVKDPFTGGTAPTGNAVKPTLRPGASTETAPSGTTAPTGDAANPTLSNPNGEGAPTDGNKPDNGKTDKDGNKGKEDQEAGALLSALTFKGDNKVLGILIYSVGAVVLATIALVIVVLARKKKAPTPPPADTPEPPTE